MTGNPKEYQWKSDSGIKSAMDKMMKRLSHLSRGQRDAVQNMLLIAAISVQTCYFQAMARQYFNAVLFLDF